MDKHNEPPTDSFDEDQGKDNNSHRLNPKFDFKNEFKEHIKEIIKPIDELKEHESLFEILTANEVSKIAKLLPEPIQLYPVLILENEMTIVFADTGVGKTVLCFQMAIYIANKGYTTLYLDLELSRKQFQRRYTSENGDLFKFPDNLHRADFKRLKKIPKNTTYEDFFFSSLIDAIKKTGAKVIFLDNLTKLAAGDTDSAKAAIPILERLNDLKSTESLTLIVLEHNKKVDTSRPIHLNDLQGSKMKSNLVDAVFTIGKSSKDKNLRYIKQVKVRDGEEIYDTENVKVCELSKSNGYLSFTDIGYESEFAHLKQQTDKDKERIIEKVIELHQQGHSLRDIGKEQGISHSTVSRIIKNCNKL